jgi:AcrR family transcriptional regulator
MSDTGKRRYHAPARAAAAARTRLAVVSAARQAFEERGWAGTRMRDVAQSAGVSQKTVEAAFGTKAALLEAAVDYAIRGDVETVPMPQREAIREMERAADAATMLDLHARHLRVVNVRSALIASVVEQAATADPAVEALWAQMTQNREFAVGWAADTLMKKRGRRPRLTRDQVRTVFWVALDWETYRTLTERAGLDAEGYESWLKGYYRAMLLTAARS